MTLRFLLPFLVAVIASFPACSSSQKTERPETRRMEREYDREEEEGEEEEGRYRPPAPWGEPTMQLRGLDVTSDTVTFHIGAPLFLRLSGDREIGCGPFDGRPFFFDGAGAQIGWGLLEVADSLVLPRGDGTCDRFLLLTSEYSNRLPEGVYTLKTLIFIDEKRSIYSDTLVVRAVRSPGGADTTSFTRFLLEQILRNSPLLADPETLAAMFAPGTPRGAEAEVYRSVILQRGGDLPGARRALLEADRIVLVRGHPLDQNASRVRGLLAPIEKQR